MQKPQEAAAALGAGEVPSSKPGPSLLVLRVVEQNAHQRDADCDKEQRGQEKEREEGLQILLGPVQKRQALAHWSGICHQSVCFYLNGPEQVFD